MLYLVVVVIIKVIIVIFFNVIVAVVFFLLRKRDNKPKLLNGFFNLVPHRFRLSHYLQLRRNQISLAQTFQFDFLPMKLSLHHDIYDKSVDAIVNGKDVLIAKQLSG